MSLDRAVEDATEALRRANRYAGIDEVARIAVEAAVYEIHQITCDGFCQATKERAERAEADWLAAHQGWVKTLEVLERERALSNYLAEAVRRGGDYAERALTEYMLAREKR